MTELTKDQLRDLYDATSKKNYGAYDEDLAAVKAIIERHSKSQGFQMHVADLVGALAGNFRELLAANRENGIYEIVGGDKRHDRKNRDKCIGDALKQLDSIVDSAFALGRLHAATGPLFFAHSMLPGYDDWPDDQYPWERPNWP